MAAEQYAELLRTGPFEGIDLTTASLFTQPSMGKNALNANPMRVKGALMVEKGRVPAVDFSAYLSRIDVVTQFVGPGNKPYIVAHGPALSGGTPSIAVYDLTLAQFFVVNPVNTYTQAIQFGQSLYTNGGQRFFGGTLQFLGNGLLGGGPPVAFMWQYTMPVPNVTLALGGSGSGQISDAFVDYVMTRKTLLPDSSVIETSVNASNFASPITQATGGGTQSVIITEAGGFTWTGTNPDGTSFTTNLYRQSNLQPGYLLVANISTEGPFTDTNSDAQLLGHAGLTVHRDPPPFINADGTSAQNYGFMLVHKNFLWIFVTISNETTNFQAQQQLWYSQFNTPWEFDDVDNVMLLQTEVNVTPPVTNFYTGLYGDEPNGLASAGTILLAFKAFNTWTVYGDGTTSNPFVQRPVFGIGCVASRSIVPLLGMVYWLTENGVMSFDGSSPMNKGEDVRGRFRQVSSISGIDIRAQQASVGMFSNLMYVLAFPTLGISYTLDTPSGKWISQLGYAPSTANAVFCRASHPSIFTTPTSPTPSDINEVLAGRPGTAFVDYWFGDPVFDLGSPQSFQWSSIRSNAQKSSWEKAYDFLTMECEPGSIGEAVVVLTTYRVDGSITTFTWTVQITEGATWYGTSVGNDDGSDGPLLGMSAQLSISATGPSAAHPPVIDAVVAWGALRENMPLPT